MARYLNLFTTAIVTGYESGKDEYFFQTGLHILLSLELIFLGYPYFSYVRRTFSAV